MVSSAVGPGSVPHVPHVPHSPPIPVGAAGIVSRVAANVIDAGVLVVIIAVGYAGFTTVRFLHHPRAFTFPAPSLLTVITIGCAAAGLYFAVCWATTGRTYGALVLGLRVVSRGRQHVRPVVAVLRAATCVVWPIGLVWSGVDRRRRSLQDIVFRTTVVYDWPGSR